MTISIPLVRFVIKAAVRDRLMIMMVLMMAVTVAVSFFMGSAAVTEQQSFSNVFAAGGLRLLGVVAMIVFSVFHVRRTFDNKETEYMLSAPMKRSHFIIGFSAGLSLLALVLTAIISMALGTIVSQLNDGILFWCVSYGVEMLVITNVALFFSIVLRSPVTSVMATCGFYVLSRLIGTILGIINAGAFSVGVGGVLGKIMLVISLIVPRLDLMAQTSWLVYGLDNGSADAIGYGFIGLQAVIFIGMVLAATLFDFQRKEF